MWPMNQKTRNCYEVLDDASHYLIKSWMRLDLPSQVEKEILSLNGAAAFLFSTYILGEKEGQEISQFLSKEQGNAFDPKALGEKASSLRTRMITPDFRNLPTNLTKYLEFLAETEDYVFLSLKDEPGRLCITYIEAVLETLMKANKDLNYLQIAEPLFLGMTSAFGGMYKEHYGAKFPELNSSPYFQFVEEAYERIRSEINE